jgi:ferredoxin-NADP reductase
MVAVWRVALLERSGCGADIMTLRFAKPAGYTFRAGQWLRLTLETPEGPQARTFSIAAAPGDDWLEMTTRASASAFKVALSELSPGDEVEIGPPGGRLSLPTASDPCFLAGGVGVTPVRSMLRHAVAEGGTFSDAVVFLGNRDASCEPYAEEFLAMRPSGVRTVRVLERPPEGWEGESGFISPATISKHVSGVESRTFVVAGPPKMVIAMQHVLDELEVPTSHRTVESFGRAEA